MKGGWGDVMLVPGQEMPVSGYGVHILRIIDTDQLHTEEKVQYKTTKEAVLPLILRILIWSRTSGSANKVFLKLISSANFFIKKKAHKK